ncbi:MAG: PASTA domain-containing protein [Candidatus Fermentithermobacillus carboniphilus]|uniref:PASTA domain-containing protein n=1 Tax=Candidatus Fermentithermobacillus carboniphilus TaxID=3085328 RepID=A0AAT9LBP6_9FIRM|nr:MAG: PASTA domain-containing protein [Candidatus Fermentithermobacillus carboniphilus]
MGAILTRKRVGLVLLFSAVSFFLLLGRLVYVQFVWAPKLLEQALDMRMQDIPIQPRRGVIYDRNGHELAFSIDVESVYAIPAQVKDPEKAAAILSQILGMKYETVLNKLTRQSAFEWVKRKIPDDIARKIKEQKIPGIGFTQESMRVWPKGTLLAQVLGIVGIDNDGLEGLEYEYDRVLRGVQGRFTVEVDAIGEALPQSQRGYIPPVQGKNLVLTVDEVIQFIAERELDKAIEKSKAKGGIVIAMDPRNGEILAMAMRPTYDPNQYDRYPVENRRITAITDSFPPGSTFKPITAAAALESGAVSVKDTFFCPGSTRVGDETLSCVTAHGSQTFYEVIENSCNVGFIQIGLRTGVDNFYKYIDLFGVTSTTGIDLPGEVSGIVVPKNQVKTIDLAVMSFGQTLQMTPIQIITSMSVIANGGYLVVPHLVKEITDVDGNVLERKPSGPVRQVISSKTSEELRMALEQVVAKGTGKAAYVPGYRLAGKTGTSNKVVDGKIAPGKYIASFVGFAPANDPRLALLVMIDEPQGAYYGGVVAAPVFSAVMRDVLRYLEIPPQEEPESDASVEMCVVPNLVGKDVVAAQAELHNLGLVGTKEGPGATVVRQFPVAGAKVARGTNVILYTEGEQEPSAGEVRVPNIIGLGLTQARLKLSEVGLSLSAQGSGFCVSQEPPAGSIVPKGTMVKAVFRMDVGQ